MKRGNAPMWVYLPVVFVLLQAVDAVLTSMGVQRYGLESEGNPIAAHLFSRWGTWPAAIAGKALSAIGFFWISLVLP